MPRALIRAFTVMKTLNPLLYPSSSIGHSIFDRAKSGSRFSLYRRHRPPPARNPLLCRFSWWKQTNKQTNKQKKTNKKKNTPDCGLVDLVLTLKKKEVLVEKAKAAIFDFLLFFKLIRERALSKVDRIIIYNVSACLYQTTRC